MIALLRRPGVATPLVATAAAVVLVVAWHALTSRIGFNVADEGFFWYGAQRTRLGDVPIRDFMAYDVGRYAYTALVFLLLGDDGIMASRVATSALLVVVVAIAIAVVVDASRRRGDPVAQRALLAAFAAALTVLWAYPTYKVFEHLATMLLVAALYGLFVRPSRAAWFALGLVVGVNATIGRNHGVYGTVSSILAGVVLHHAATGQRVTPSDGVAWCVGGVVGYAPVLWMLASVDGFAHPFIDWIVWQVRSGATNLGVPIPWPWVTPDETDALGVYLTLFPIAFGSGFLLIVLFPAFALVRLVRAGTLRSSQGIVSAIACAALPYVQYAYSRADSIHLAVAMVPVCLGLVLSIDARRTAARLVLLVALVGFSVVALFESPVVNYWMTRGHRWEVVRVGDAHLRTDYVSARRWTHANALVGDPGERTDFLGLPDMMSLHAARRQPMVVHDIYVLSPTGPENEAAEIGRLSAARPAVILLSNGANEKIALRRFSALRPATFDWIERNYDRTTSALPRDLDPLEVYTIRRDADRR